MKLRKQAKIALATVLCGGVLTACESEYDPTVAEPNQPITENQQEITDTDDAMGNSGITGDSAANSNSDTATSNRMNENLADDSGTNTDALADESSTSGEPEIADRTTSDEYGITDERDGTPDTGSWDDSMASENAQTSGMQTGETAADENREDSISGTFDDVQSDVAAKEQQAVQFEFDSAELTDEAKSKLDDFIASMEEIDPQEAELVIKGYTDTQGSEEYNQALAGRRAEAVKEYLQEQGLPSENLKTEAVGEAPSESVAATSQDNRRVVVEIVVPYAEELTAN